MNHPELMRANAQLRFDAYVKSAENYRRIKKLTPKGPGSASRLLSLINDGLAALRGRVTVPAKPDSDLPVLND